SRRYHQRISQGRGARLRRKGRADAVEPAPRSMLVAAVPLTRGPGREHEAARDGRHRPWRTERWANRVTGPGDTEYEVGESTDRTREEPFFIDSPESARAIEYLIAASQAATEGVVPAGPECASAFAAMIMNGGLDVGPQESERGDLTDLELAARRDLSLWDAHAIAVIGAA